MVLKRKRLQRHDMACFMCGGDDCLLEEVTEPRVRFGLTQYTVKAASELSHTLRSTFVSS